MKHALIFCTCPKALVVLNTSHLTPVMLGTCCSPRSQLFQKCGPSAPPLQECTQCGFTALVWDGALNVHRTDVWLKCKWEMQQPKEMVLAHLMRYHCSPVLYSSASHTFPLQKKRRCHWLSNTGLCVCDSNIIAFCLSPFCGAINTSPKR